MNKEQYEKLMQVSREARSIVCRIDFLEQQIVKQGIEDEEVSYALAAYLNDGVVRKALAVKWLEELRADIALETSELHNRFKEL